MATIIWDPKDIPERKSKVPIPGAKPPVRKFPYSDPELTVEEVDEFIRYIREPGSR